MSWPKEKQIEAERAWFVATADEVARVCGGSLISGRRTRKRNKGLGKKAHSKSLHLDGLAGDYEFDTAFGYGKAWSLGRSLGLHGYRKPNSQGIHWQARPSKKKAS